jgi:hypothetical protein
MGCQGVHKWAQTEDCASYQSVVEVELRENGVANCGKGWVLLGGISFESREVEGGEYY